MAATGTAWKAVAIGVAIAIGGNAIGWLWGNLKETMVEGKADEAVVTELKAAVKVIDESNIKEHRDIKDRQKRDGRVLRAVAKKLKVDLPPEPQE